MPSDNTSVKPIIMEAFDSSRIYLPNFPRCGLKSLNPIATISKKSVFHSFQNDMDKGYSYKIKQIIDEIKQANLPLHQEPLKVIVFGGDVDIQTFAQEISEIFKKDFQIFTNLDFRVFIIPTSKNCLANFIASKDIWYKNNLYSPFIDDLLFPKVDAEEISGNKSNFIVNKSLLPFEIMENIVQTYLREAARVFPIRVYEVVGFRQTVDQKIPDSLLHIYSLFFCI